MRPVSTMAARVLAAAVALSVSLAPAVAGANMAAVRRNPSRVVGPKPARDTQIQVDHERLLLLCWEEQRRPVCTFEAHYKVHNAGREHEDTAAAFYGVSTRSVAVKVDGAPAAAKLSPEDIAALDKAVLTTGGEAPDRIAAGDRGTRFDRAGFVLSTDPRARHEIVVTGQMMPGRRFIPQGYSRSAVVARHLLFAKAEETILFDLEYLVWPIRTWKGDPRIDVQIVHPAGWTVRIAGDDGKRWTHGREGESVVLSRSLKAEELPVIALEIEPPVSAVHAGGMLLGIGGTTRPEKGVRARIGYEFAAPSFLLYSLSADTNFRDRFIVTPLIEAASPAALILPSFGLGVGMPVQIKPDTRLGVRLQGDMHFFPIGFVTSVDIYPKFGDATKTFVEASFLAQIGL